MTSLRTCTWLFLLLFVAAPGCKESTTAPKQTAGDVAEARADQVIYGLSHKITAQGIRKADLKADTAYTRPNDTRVNLKGVDLTFYDVNGKQTGHLTSRTGEYDLASRIMIARGKVVLVLTGEKGPRTIRSEELHYEQQANRVWSDKKTSLEEAGQTYHGNGFESDLTFTNVSVRSLKTSAITTKSGGGMRF